MRRVSPETLLCHIRRLAVPGPGDLSDRELVRCFATAADAGAFEALLRRHGPMALGVCRRVLRHEQDAEDAFQATFLTLARKAASLRDQESVGNWLYGVAYRQALNVRAALARRSDHQRRATPPTVAEPLAEITLREAQEVLDAELSRLPERLRAPLVLCCLEGLARDEAARRLGLPLGTLKARLERGRQLLRARLTRRGLTLTAALSATLLGEGAAQAELPAPLLRTTLQTALAESAPAVVASTALTLAGARLKVGAVLLLAAGLLAVGTGLLAHRVPDDSAPVSGGERRAESAPARKEEARTDRYGDPLPPGALARLGTVRFRHPGQIMALAVSPDGKTLATGGHPGRVRLWDAATGKPMGTLAGPEGHVFGLCFSPDGSLLAACGSLSADHNAPGRTVLLDLHTGKARHTLQHQRWARCLTFSPDGTTLVVGCDQIEFSVWEVASGKERPHLPGEFGAGFASVAFSPDGTLVVAGGYDKAIRLWDPRAGREVGRLDAGSIVRSLAFSRDGKTLLSGGDGPHFVRLWDVVGRKVLREYEGHKGNGSFFPGSSYAVALSPDQDSVASGGDDGALLLWDAHTAELRARHQDWAGSVYGVAFTPDGKTLIAAGTMGRVRLFDAATGKERALFDEHTAALSDLALSPDGKLLATAGADTTIRLWDLAAARTVRVLRGHRTGVYSVHFSPDGRSLVSGGGDGTVRVWDVATGEGRELTDAHQWYSRAAFAPNGKLLASAGADSKVRLWDVASGRQVGQMTGHVGYLVGLGISRDGKWLATTGESYVGADGSHEDKTIRLWDVAKRAEVRRFTRSYFYSGPLHFTPDSRTFVYSDGGTLHFVDLATGWEPSRPAHTDMMDFTFAAAGRWLVTREKDQTIRLRELASGLELHRLTPPGRDVSCMLLGPGDRTLLTLNEDATVLVWDLAPVGGHPGDLDRSWAALAGADGPAAYRALWALASTPGPTVAGLRLRLPGAVRAVTARDRRIRGLIADLDSDSFARREAASRELAACGDEATPALRLALAGRPSAEARKRLEDLLAKAGDLRPGEALRCLRALVVLERIGTPEARQLLETVAEGAPEDWLAREAKTSLECLARRPGRDRPRYGKMSWPVPFPATLQG
jgi:RNA polymerase sigma factor (sigma-70 family)